MTVKQLKNIIANDVFLWAYEGATLDTCENLPKGTVFASGVRLLEEVR